MVVLVNFHTFGFIDEMHIYWYSHYSLYILQQIHNFLISLHITITDKDRQLDKRTDRD